MNRKFGSHVFASRVCKKRVQSVYSLYLDGDKQISKRISISAGMRFETTNVKGVSENTEISNRDYFNFFPRLSVGIGLNENNNVSLNYNRKITRPNFRDLNPYRIYLDQFSYSEGNPNLTPSYEQNFELSYLFKRHLGLSLFFKKSSDRFQDINIPDEINKTTHFKVLNYFDEYRKGINIMYNKSLFRWFQTSINISTYRYINLRFIKT